MATEKIDLNNLDKSDWKTYRFDEIAQNISERVDPNNTDLEVYIGLEHIDSESLHIKRHGTPDDVNGTKLKFYKDDIIFGRRRAYQRKAGIATCDGFCSAHALVLRANPDVIDPALFPFFMHSDLFMNRAVDISVGSLSPTINWGTLKHQEFLIPPKSMQADVIDLLKYSNLNCSTKSELYEASMQALKSFVKEEVFNEHFERIKIKELYNVRRGASPRPINNPDYFSEKGRGWIRISDVSKSNKYLISTEQKLSDLGVSKSVKVDEGNIIMSICATIGLPTIIKTPSCIHDGFVLFQPKSNKIMPEILYYILWFSEEYFVSKRQVGTQGNLNTTIVGNTKIPLVPLSNQENLLNLINKLEKSISDSQESFNKSKELENSILNKVF